ncbi:hypothetical protein HNY73_010355 [Argiope bruennichi]|uniref:Uncharacterized protein n=1 Tax=Argiope bruennichi TaxID=94029 RepID=A0A8T0F1K1_ARGBR|nr:hypothetical protein HNY73_010355 [Argiope bruennichi]
MRACPVAWDRHQLTLPNDVNRWNLEESLQLISRERASGQEQTEAVSLAAEKGFHNITTGCNQLYTM